MEECSDEVYLASRHGDKLFLKSSMSRYVAIGALLSERGDELELYCDNKEDEARFINFFYTHEDIL